MIYYDDKEILIHDMNLVPRSLTWSESAVSLEYFLAV